MPTLTFAASAFAATYLGAVPCSSTSIKAGTSIQNS